MTVRMLLFEFRLGDVEDPQLYAALPLYHWQESPAGQWCKTHCVPDSIVWTTGIDQSYYGYKVQVHGMMSEQDATVFRLKWL